MERLGLSDGAPSGTWGKILLKGADVVREALTRLVRMGGAAADNQPKYDRDRQGELRCCSRPWR